LVMLKLRLFGYRIGLAVKFSVIKTMFVKGVNSSCHDEKNHHILLWDFDHDLDLDKIKKELKRIQKLWKLGDIHILQSGERSSYRAICCTKVPWTDALRIIMQTFGSCLAYIQMAELRRTFTMRISDKGGEPIRWIHTLMWWTDRQYSFPHALLCYKLWGIPLPPRQLCDDVEKISLVKYETTYFTPKKGENP